MGTVNLPGTVEMPGIAYPIPLEVMRNRDREAVDWLRRRTKLLRKCEDRSERRVARLLMLLMMYEDCVERCGLEAIVKAVEANAPTKLGEFLD